MFLKVVSNISEIMTWILLSGYFDVSLLMSKIPYLLFSLRVVSMFYALPCGFMTGV
jgi:hypothetical protein